MTIAFTICSNNYFAQAHVLAKSFLVHHAESKFYIVITDKLNSSVAVSDTRIGIIPIDIIEPNILDLAAKFNIIELNTAVKPTAFMYLFRTTAAINIVYLDPDIYVYHQFSGFNELLGKYNALLTPHSLSPIPLDGRTLQENDFLNFGIYNLGFAAFRRTDQSIKILEWWKERTYNLGYINLGIGLFTDQIWMNLVPVYFDDVHILKGPGYNMAPWNLHERALTIHESEILVNSSCPLYFYHFSTFNPLKPEMIIHPVFNRFNFENRRDLIGIYTDYKNALLDAGFRELSMLPCYYVIWRKAHLVVTAQDELNRSSVWNRLYVRVKKIIPIKMRHSISSLVKG